MSSADVERTKNKRSVMNPVMRGARLACVCIERCVIGVESDRRVQKRMRFISQSSQSSDKAHKLHLGFEIYGNDDRQYSQAEAIFNFPYPFGGFYLHSKLKRKPLISRMSV